MSIEKTVLEEEKKAFIAGELVKLKSDGPVMTVINNITGNPFGVKCVWFNTSTNSYVTMDFAESTLERFDKEQ